MVDASASRKSQGKITTQNTQLLSLLREDSKNINNKENNNNNKNNNNNMDKPLRKVYVQSPAFSPEDEDKYRFISTNVDDFDEDHEKMLNNLNSARSMLTDAPINTERFEDRNQKMISGRGGVRLHNEGLMSDRQYVMKSSSNPSSRKSSSNSLVDRPPYSKAPGYSYNDDRLAPNHFASGSNLNSYRSGAPETGRMSEEEMLAQEARYQEQLRERLVQQEDQISQKYYIPSLPVADADGDDIYQRDSLEEQPYKSHSRTNEGDRGMARDSLDWEDPPPNPFKNHRDLDIGRFGEDLKEKRLKDQDKIVTDPRVLPLYRGGVAPKRDKSETEVTRYSEDSLEEESGIPIESGSTKSLPVGRTGPIQPKPVMSGGAEALQRRQDKARSRGEASHRTNLQDPETGISNHVSQNTPQRQQQPSLREYHAHNPFPENNALTGRSQIGSSASQEPLNLQDRRPVGQFVPQTQGSLQGQVYNPQFQGQIPVQHQGNMYQPMGQQNMVNPLQPAQIIPLSNGQYMLPQSQFVQGQVIPQYANQLQFVGQTPYIQQPNMQIYGAQGQMVQQPVIQGQMQPLLGQGQFMSPPQQQYMLGQVYPQGNLPPQYQGQVPSGQGQTVAGQPQGQAWEDNEDEEDVEDEYNEDDATEEDDTDQNKALQPIRATMTSKQSNQPTQPQIDYVEMNKDMNSQKPKKTYNQIFSRRKEDQETKTVDGRPPIPRKTVGKGVQQPNRQPDAANQPFNGNPEDVWAQRSASLARQKELKNSGGKKGKRRPLQKYPSDSGVNLTAAPPVPVPPIQSYTEPIRSEVVVDPGGLSPGRPVTHTLVTEDGQRVSVDINLKLLSPPPQAPPPPQQPPQHAAQRVNRGPAKPRQQPTQTNQEAYPSPRENMSVVRNSPHQSAPMSPYRILPPISAESEPDTGNRRQQPQSTYENGPKSPRSEDGYLAQFNRTRAKKNQYKEYTLDDYRRLKNELEVMKKNTGGLGPDLANVDLREKREKELRKIQYAKEVALKNRQKMQKQALRAGRPGDRTLDEDADEALNKRRIALEYAKNVPRPKVKPDPRLEPPSPSTEPHFGGPALKKLSDQSGDLDLGVYDFSNLRSLQERHEQDKRQAALIRQDIEGVL